MPNTTNRYPVRPGLVQEVAAACYDAVRDARSDRRMPPFEMCPEHVRDNWETIARAAIAAVLDDAASESKRAARPTGTRG